MPSPNHFLFPSAAIPKDSLLSQMQAMKTADAQWQSGKTFSYVYYAGDDILETVKEAYQLFFSENALNPSAFQSLRRMENEVIAMMVDLFNGPANGVGSMTSGGTESILMAVKTAREWMRQQHSDINTPEIVLPTTAHPAFHKACYYFGLKAIVVAVGADYRAVPATMEAAITERTAMLVGSAPSYPQGVVDPITEIAKIAQKHQRLCHVDACVGGMMLPFLKEAGYLIPAFDFGVPGVTSISADLHKYGYAAKGASVILYRTAELRKHQFYVYTPWSGGIYASPSIAGTRPGGAIAAAWAALQYIGKEGYIRLARECMETTQRFREGILSIDGLNILGKPDMTLLAIASDSLDVYELGDEMGLLGWSIDRQQAPPSLHLTITPAHTQQVESFLNDLRTCVAKVKKPSLGKASRKAQLGTVKLLKKVLPNHWISRMQQLAAKHSEVGGKRSAAMYGMMGELKGSGDMEAMVKSFLDKLFRR